MQLTYLGHSGIALEIDSSATDAATSYKGQVLIDPFLTGNPVATLDASDLSPSHIVVTHAHGDHYGDTEAIATHANATLISTFEIVNYAAKKGVNGHGMNIGGGYSFGFGRVTFTPAWHSSAFPDGTYGGMPMGTVIESEGKTLYHAGDTALFSDMRLIGETWSLDLALLPIGDNFTMGPSAALKAVALLSPKVVIPIHYNTFDVITQDANAFKAQIERETNARCVVLEPGQQYTL
jgi:L-ascorbate metabolism protein UlaG (beta-lactamase superfamily)